MQSNPLAFIRYYIMTSYRRKLVDKLLEKHQEQFSGMVLDIGGRSRGRFIKPKKDVKRWVFADINPKHRPDIVLDVADMKEIENQSIDVISACELFEHVEHIERGLDECARVLKPGGRMIISVPFLYPVHADPSDYQRWTEFKWKEELTRRKLHIETCMVMGRFFTIMADYTKIFFVALPKPLNFFLLVISPLLDLFVQLDSLNLIQSHPRLGKFHGGYFIIVKKKL